jgi:hypothetical protein
LPTPRSCISSEDPSVGGDDGVAFDSSAAFTGDAKPIRNARNSVAAAVVLVTIIFGLNALSDWS